MKNKQPQANKAARRNYLPAPLDWNQAMCVARARLNEKFIQPDAASDSRVAGEVASLAAQVCAYGELAEEVDRMEARADEPLIREPPKRKPA